MPATTTTTAAALATVSFVDPHTTVQSIVDSNVDSFVDTLTGSEIRHYDSPEHCAYAHAENVFDTLGEHGLREHRVAALVAYFCQLLDRGLDADRVHAFCREQARVPHREVEARLLSSLLEQAEEVPRVYRTGPQATALGDACSQLQNARRALEEAAFLLAAAGLGVWAAEIAELGRAVAPIEDQSGDMYALGR